MPISSPILAAPHRPFFLAAGISAAVTLALWLLAWVRAVPLTATWHGHEMVFGFGAAAIAGFLLTAVPNWTGRAPIRGLPLLALLLVWVSGRTVALFPAGTWFDLLFLPALAAMVGSAILRARNRRNYAVPPMLVVLTLCNVDYHFGDPSRALWLATLLITGLIALIGGRITPLFTQNALRQAILPDIICQTPPVVDRLAIPAVFLTLMAELVAPHSAWSGGAAILAAAVLGVRMLGWQTLRTLRYPILWVLHAGYAWVPFGYALIGASFLFDAVAPTAALHALTAGAIGVMVLAVMSRAALGHSGRPLRTPRLTVIAYILVNLGALIRVTASESSAILVAGLIWALGYVLFVIDFWPILTQPRPDGRPG